MRGGGSGGDAGWSAIRPTFHWILRSRNILLKFRTNFSVGFTCTVRLDVGTLYSSPNFHDPCLPEARAAPLLDYATRPLDSARELLIHNHHLVMASARPRCSGWRGARPCRSLLPCATVRYCARTPHPLRASTRRAYASTAHSTRRAFSSTTRREAAPRRRPHRPHRRAVRARVSPSTRSTVTTSTRCYDATRKPQRASATLCAACSPPWRWPTLRLPPSRWASRPLSCSCAARRPRR